MFWKDTSWRVAMLSALLVSVGLAVGCGGGDGDGNGGDGEEASPNLTVSGFTQGLTTQGQASPLSGASVEVRTDRDGDGEISSSERFRGETDGEGEYTVEVEGEAGRNLVVTYRASGYADHHETLRLDEIADVEVDASLSSTEPLDCRASVCNTEDRSLQLRGLPREVTGQGRTFNPAVDTDAFPGDFSDDQGNMLVSGVFAHVDLEDAEGNPVDELDEPATLRMRFPRDTWSAIRDIETGNGQIDVPLYAYEETGGEWVRDGRAVLVDEDGERLAESTLGEIQTRDYQGVVYASGEVDHFSYWNVDWPIESHGSIRGKVVDADGAPAQGGIVDVFGVTYTGNSSPQTLPSDGTFCVDVMRSENDDEDIDGNGQSGDTHEVAIRARLAGTRYDLGSVEVPVEQSSCGDGNGYDVGTVELTPDRELQAEICETTVDVVDFDGNPYEGATVFAFDNTIPSETYQEMYYGSGEQNCSFFPSADEQGRAEIRIPVVDRLSLWASANGTNPEAETSVRTGTSTVAGCPDGGVTLTLDQGYDFFDLEVSVQGNQISWEPPVSASSIQVTGSETFKWWVFESEATLESPVTYGRGPEGADVAWPLEGGAPGALSSGDEVTVWASGTSDRGIFEMYIGSTTAP